MPNTIRLHRVLRAPPDRVYRAFLDPDARVKWLPPNGFTAGGISSSCRTSGSATATRSTMPICRARWQESLFLLAKLVEAEIPD